jgi:hypothetical protein
VLFLTLRSSVPRKKVMSQRDVPGLTKAAIPIMLQNGVAALSIGTNGGSAPVNVPKVCLILFYFYFPESFPQAFIWRFNETSSVRAFWLGGGYSGFPTAPHIVALTEVGDAALVVMWRGDNAGPPIDAAEVIRDWETLNLQFPGAQIVASTFDGFVEAIANVSDDFFPVIDREIADTWIYGIASDPIKVRDMRILQSMRSACVEAGECELSDERFFNFSVIALKNGEHTWGRDQKVALGSYVSSNWTNAEFATLVNTDNFTTYSGSWILQRHMGITDAVSALGDHPLAAQLQSALATAAQPTKVDTSNWKPVAAGMTLPLSESHELTLGENGRISSFSIGGLNSAKGSFGDLTYTTYSEADYTTFASEYNYGYPATTIDKYDFLKVNLPASANHVDESVAFVGGFLGPSAAVLNYAPSSWIVANAGAPPLIQILVEVGQANSFRLSVIVANKTATRLPESTSVRFAPSSSCSWSMSKLGQVIDPSNVQQGGSKHLHAVDKVSCGGLHIEPIDAPLVSFGTRSAFPTPISATLPNLQSAASFVLHNNLWNTNYIMWFPYTTNQDITFRFHVALTEQ